MSIALVLDPPQRDLGDGFHVRRALPSARRQMVGPFIFLDEMGPATFAPGEGLDVRPHPHIGLSTLTYLFEGEILHADSLGVVQPIEPGAVNWMTAGAGIVHSERTRTEVRAAGARLHGLQAWIALPNEAEDAAPSFRHHPAATLPALDFAGARATLIAGSAYGASAPVEVASPLFYAIVDADDGAVIPLPDEHAERAVYIVSGAIEHDGQRVEAGHLAILAPGAAAHWTARGRTRAAMIGGAPVGPRLIWWNFVASTAARIDAAAQRWQAGGFATVPGDEEFIPLPDAPERPVNYP